MVVYLAINKINNKGYVGITNQTYKARWGQHKRESKKENPKCVFQKALKKYGIENFEWSFLQNNLSKEDAKKWEKMWIKLLGTHITEYGYNVSWGGDLGTPHSEETKKKMSNRLMGRPRPDISAANKKQIKNGTFHFLRQNLTKELLDKRAENNRKRNAKQIRCIETGEIYRSGQEIADILKVNRNAIYNAIKRSGTCHGQHFEYLKKEGI